MYSQAFINRNQTVDRWNSGSTGPAARSTPLQGWLLLSHMLRPPLMSLSAPCHLQIVTVAPSATNPIFPAAFGAQQSVSGPQSPGLAGGYRQCVRPLPSPAVASLLPAPSCTAVLCPRKQCWFNLCCPCPCPCPSSPHTSGHTCAHACAGSTLDMARETYGFKHMCVCFPSQIYFGKYESAAAAAAARTYYIISGSQENLTVY